MSALAGRIWRGVCIAGLVVFVAIQFIRPAISHPPVTADLAAPPEVAADSEEFLLRLPFERDQAGLVR